MNSLVDRQSGSSAPVYINQGFSFDEKSSPVSGSVSQRSATEDIKGPYLECASQESLKTLIPSETIAERGTATSPASTCIKLDAGTLEAEHSASGPPDCFNSRGSTACSLLWNNLSFEVKKKVWSFESGFPIRKDFQKQILQPQNGEIYSGSLTALMGPSGAGKTTLLNCITGRNVTGVTGEISIICPGSKPKATIAFVPQKDTLYMTFTVRETLIFASKMKNLGKNVNHENEALKVVKSLTLDDCYNLKLSKCSGGEVKRVSIAVELISDPDILVLDEPTTGLDSSTALLCVELLKKLIESKVKPPAIVATIHQPNYKIFQRFTSIYLLSCDGHKLYQGPPANIIDHFAKYNLICPIYCNPADFAIEVAFGDHGEQVFKLMNEETRAIKYTGEGCGTKYDMNKVLFKLGQKHLPFFRHTGLLLNRNWSHMMRDSHQFWLKNLFAILVALISSHLWQYKIGESDGCWDSFSVAINTTDLKRNFFQVNTSVILNEYLTKISRLSDNSAMIFSLATFSMTVAFGSCVISFPFQAATVVKEIGNNWYKASSFFISKLTCDLPSALTTSFLLLIIIYPLTGQIAEVWRFLLFYLFVILMADICHSMAMFFSVLMNNDMVAAILCFGIFGVPAMVFSGFFVRDSAIPWYFKGLSQTSFLKYGFEGIHLAIYGFGRCSFAGVTPNALDTITNSNSSRALANNLWNVLNVTYSDIQHISSILNIQEDCFGSVVNSSMEYNGYEYHDPYSTTTTTPAYESIGPGTSFVKDDSPIKNPSYVLSYFEMTESMIWMDIFGLLIYSFLSKTCTYLILRHRTRTSA